MKEYLRLDLLQVTPMKHLLFLTLIFQITLTIKSQNLEWDNVYPNYLSLGKALTTDNDNNVISVGNGFSQAAFNEFIYIEKLSPEGQLIWKDSVSTNGSNNYHAATWVGVDNNNEIFIVGYSYNLSLQNEVPNAIVVLKFSSNGELLNNTSVPGFFNRDGNTNLGKRNESALDEQGNLYVASAGATNTLNGAGLLLLKFDNNASLIWERLQSFGSIHGLRGMHYNNGKIALMGTSSTTGTNNIISVWNQQGDIVWSSTGSIPNQTWATDVLLDESGNTYTLCQNYGTSYNLIELTKYDVNGEEIFSKQYDINIAATSGRMALLSNGNLAISGTNWTISGPGKLFVAQVLPENGNEIFYATYSLPQSNNWVYDIISTNSNHYYLAGQSDNNGGAPSSMFLYAFSATDGFQWDAAYNIEGVKPMSLAADAEENIYVQLENKNTVLKYNQDIVLNAKTISKSFTKSNIYPNPTSENAILEIELSNPNNSSIQILNAFGEIVYEFSSNQFSNGLNYLELDLEHLSCGIYYCLIKDSKTTKTLKIIRL